MNTELNESAAASIMYVPKIRYLQINKKPSYKLQKPIEWNDNWIKAELKQYNAV